MGGVGDGRLWGVGGRVQSIADFSLQLKFYSPFCINKTQANLKSCVLYRLIETNYIHHIFTILTKICVRVTPILMTR